MSPIDPADVVRGQYVGFRDIDGVSPDSETETFIALKCYIDNWRWAGVPFYLRTGKRLAEGARIISIAFKERPRRCSGPGRSSTRPRPPDLRLADRAKMSLSFYGKRPGPGMKLDKLSMQFAMTDTGWAASARRRAADLRRGARRPTVFTTAGAPTAGSCRRRCGERAVVRPYAQGRGVPTRYSWWRRSPGGSPSSGPGATPTTGQVSTGTVSRWAMADERLTQPGPGDVRAYLDSVPDERRRADALAALDLMAARSPAPSP